MAPRLSVVIPVYNEARRVGATLEACAVFLRARKGSSEMIVVDDGSTDGTGRVVRSKKGRFPRSCRFRVLEHPANRGKGAAVRTGVLAARGDVILYMDADNATPLSEYRKMEAPFSSGRDVVIGSRAIDRSQVRRHQPLHREWMGRVFNLMVQVLAVPGLWDTQCGFKAFTHEAACDIFPLQTIERFGFDVELLYIARRKGRRIGEIQVAWTDSPDSRVRVFRDSVRMFLDLLVIRMNDLRGRYPR